MRRDRAQARRNYLWAVDFEKRLRAGKDQRKGGASEHAGKGKYGRHGKKGASEWVEPIYWQDMSDNDRWWMYEFWNGHLKRCKTAIEYQYSGGQADDFELVNDDDL